MLEELPVAVPISDDSEKGFSQSHDQGAVIYNAHVAYASDLHKENSTVGIDYIESDAATLERLVLSNDAKGISNFLSQIRADHTTRKKCL